MVWNGMVHHVLHIFLHLVFAQNELTVSVQESLNLQPGFLFIFFSLDVVVFARTLHTGAAQGRALSSRIGSTGEVLLS